MSSTASEMLEDSLKAEFEQAYSDRDLFTEYCIENHITLTPERADEYDEEDFNEFKEFKFEEYKSERLDKWQQIVR